MEEDEIEELIEAIEEQEVKEEPKKEEKYALTDLENPEMKSILQHTVEKVLRETAEAQGLNCDFVVSVSPLLNADASISAGYPPTVTLRSVFIADFVFSAASQKEFDKNKKRFRRNMASIVSKIHFQERTLSHNPKAELLVFKKSKWFKTNNPDAIIFTIPEGFIDVEETYTVTMREINSGISVTLSGKNPTFLRQSCREKLTGMVAANEALLEKLQQEEDAKIISSIDIRFSRNEELGDQVKFNYKLEEEEKKDGN